MKRGQRGERMKAGKMGERAEIRIGGRRDREENLYSFSIVWGKEEEEGLKRRVSLGEKKEKCK